MEVQDQQYLLKITLLHIKPEIWRRFAVPAGLSLDRLHDVIQIVMGWLDHHVYYFKISGKNYTEEPESEEEGLEAGKYLLKNLVKSKDSVFRYLYDLGDNWEHEILLEDPSYEPEVTLASQFFGKPEIDCLEGARACPPEDVGGTDGYLSFCKSIKDPKHKEHKSLREWYAQLGYGRSEYDSEKFDLERVAGEIYKYQRWSRLRPL
jgi:hypothetical protein